MEPGKVDRNTNLSRGFVICSVVVAFLVGSAAFWGSNKQALGLFHDDGIYTVVAKAIYQGEGYRIISLPKAPPQTKYPFLYSYLLSWIWRLSPNFPQNIVAFKGLNAVTLVGIFFLCLMFCRRSFAPLGFGAVIFSILVCANPIIFTFTDYMISDLLFVLLALTVLTICANEIDDPAATTLARISLLAVVTGLGFFLVVRSAMGIASGSCSTGLGRDLVNPLDSLAKTFWVCAALEGRGTVVTSFTPMASPPPPPPQLSPRLFPATHA